MIDIETDALLKHMHELLEALEPFADVDGEGDEDFEDLTPVTVKFGRTTHYPIRLRDFRKARMTWNAVYDTLYEAGLIVPPIRTGS